MKKNKIIIGIPSIGNVRVETVVSLCKMLSSTPGLIYEIVDPITSYIPHNRELIAKEAVRLDADYVLYIDTDMTFPADALTKLLSRNKEIIGVMYNYKGTPPRPTAKLDPKYKDECKVIEKNGEVFGSITDETKPFRCRAVGTGFFIIKVSVLKKLERPYFTFIPETENNEVVGEDVYFCDKAREAGYEIWCDPTIKIGHIGLMIF
jgi:hypothetical protein